MGCGIHFYIETAHLPYTPDGAALIPSQESNAVETESDVQARLRVAYENPALRWRAFGGRIRIPRDYQLFAMLANVRNYGNLPFIEPRGIPSNLSNEVEVEYYYRIDYELENDTTCHYEYDDITGGRKVNAATAAHLHEYGSAYFGVFEPYTMTSTHKDENGVLVATTETPAAEHAGKPLCVARGDWHTPSWLSGEEFAQVIKAYQIRFADREFCPCVRAASNIMQTFIEDGSGAFARCVFWFDN